MLLFHREKNFNAECAEIAEIIGGKNAEKNILNAEIAKNAEKSC